MKKDLKNYFTDTIIALIVVGIIFAIISYVSPVNEQEFQKDMQQQCFTNGHYDHAKLQSCNKWVMGTSQN